MSLAKQLIEDMKQAMKDRDKVKLGAIRFLRSQIKNYEIDHGEQDSAGVEKLIAKEVKQIKESITEYQKAGRDDLVEEEKAKLAVLEAYLPEQLSEEKIKEIVKEVIDGQENPQMGPVIGQVMAKVGTRADGGSVSALVKEMLAA